MAWKGTDGKGQRQVIKNKKLKSALKLKQRGRVAKAAPPVLNALVRCTHTMTDTDIAADGRRLEAAAAAV